MSRVDLRGKVEDGLRESWGLSFLKGSHHSVGESGSMYLWSADYVSDYVSTRHYRMRDTKITTTCLFFLKMYMLGAKPNDTIRQSKTRQVEAIVKSPAEDTIIL